MVSRSEKGAILNELDEYDRPLHLFGQSGVGKTKLLNQIKEDLNSETLLINSSSRYDFSKLLEFILLRLKERRSNLEEAKNLVKRVRGIGVSGLGKVEIESFNPTLLEEIKNLVDDTDAELILLLDDIHLLSENSQELSDFLRELDEISGNLKIVSSGQVGLNQEIKQFLVDCFTLSEAKEFFEERGYKLNNIDVEEIHEKTDGHPFMLHLLVESQEELADFSLPEAKIFEYIEESFLESLDSEEEKFLKNVSPLLEFDSITCSRVLDKDETDTDRLLRSLNKKQIIERAGHRFGGVSNYRMHSQLRNLLYQRNQKSEEIHRRAFNYYSEKVLEKNKEEETRLIDSFLPVVMTEYHLDQIVDEKNPEKIYQEIEKLELGQPGKSLFVMQYSSFFLTDKRRNKLMYDEIGELAEYVRNKEELSEGRKNLMVSLLDLAKGSLGRFLANIDEGKKAVRKDTVETLENTYERVKEDNINLDIPVDEFQLEESSIEDPERLFRYIVSLVSCYEIQKNCRAMGDLSKEEEYREKFEERLSELGFKPQVWRHLKEELGDFRDNIIDGLNLEERMEEVAEGMVDELQDEDFSRGLLMDIQEELSQISQSLEEMFKTGSFFSRTDLEKDYFVVKAESIGNILERNDNPIFAYMWLSFTENLFNEWGIMNERQEEVFRNNVEDLKETRKKFEKEINRMAAVEKMGYREE